MRLAIALHQGRFPAIEVNSFFATIRFVYRRNLPSQPSGSIAMVLCLDNLPAEQLLAALLTDPRDLLDEERFAVNDFIQRIGGRENALRAAQMLCGLEQQNA